MIVHIQKNIIEEKYRNFGSDINEILERKPKIIGEWKAMFLKSNISASFMIMDETFMVWPCYHDDKSWLTIFNLSLNKIEKTLNIGITRISVVATYPYNDKIDCIKWIYCTDDSGNFFIFEVNRKKNFTEIIKIKTENENGIHSSIIFPSSVPNIIYVAFAFHDEKTPIEIYQIGVESEKLITLKNPTGKYCASMSSCLDDKTGKNLLLCGFSNCLKFYDLQKKKWIAEEFEMSGAVNCIKVYDKQAILTQKNGPMILIDLESFSIISKISIYDLSIYDLCLWNSGQKKIMVVGKGEDENFIKILSLPDLKVLETFEINNNDVPINCMKILLKEGKSGNFQEKLALCMKSKETNKIFLY